MCAMQKMADQKSDAQGELHLPVPEVCSGSCTSQVCHIQYANLCCALRSASMQGDLVAEHKVARTELCYAYCTVV